MLSTELGSVFAIQISKSISKNKKQKKQICIKLEN